MKRALAHMMAAAGVVYALPAMAADDGLPQFNTALYPEQLFWLAINFGLLYLLMRFFALPNVERTQDKRRQVIDSALDAARAANEQAKAMGHATEKALAEARAKAQGTITGIKAEASKEAVERQAEQSKQLQARLKESESKIAAARDTAMTDIESVAIGLASSIVDVVSGRGARA